MKYENGKKIGHNPTLIDFQGYSRGQGYSRSLSFIIFRGGSERGGQGERVSYPRQRMSPLEPPATPTLSLPLALFLPQRYHQENCFI